MYLQDDADYATRASMLIRQLTDEHDPRFGVGSMTCSVYDTAWVAMVAKTTEGQTRWLYPSSFEYLLGTQQPDGGWQMSSSDIDGILNTLAALLALCKHLVTPHQISNESREDLEHRKTRAIYWLETKFSQWDISSVTHPGSETLVSKILQLLEQEGAEFFFNGKDRLMDLRKTALAKTNYAVLYSNVRTAMTHSLEGLIGEIDFDRVAQHKISGSMMASPASTAAYLMNSSTWDDESEAYLSHVLTSRSGQITGGVPSKFPSTVFEMTGVLTTLLENGFDTEDLGLTALKNAAGFLHDSLQLESGVTGFAPYVESDADNTAKAISALCRLGHSASPQGLIIRYETRQYFKTYTQDRSPSFRTNCHVLKALLDLLPGNNEQTSQIEKAVKFICNCWWTTNGMIEDKSNTSPNYPTLLMADVFVRLIEMWDKRLVPVPEDPTMKDKVIISLFQALIRTLQTQNLDGSWGRNQRCETTAYAVLTLAKLSGLSSAPRVKLQYTKAIENGRRYLSTNLRPFSEPDHVWNGKTTCGSSVLHQAYVLAALQAPVPRHPSRPTIESHFEVPLAKVAIQTKYYGRQAWFANTPEWLVQACLVESYLFLPQIRNVRFAVFPSDSLVEDSHFEYIPFMWIAANKLDGRSVGPEFLYQMMILSLLERQFDNYMTNVVGEIFVGCLFEIEDVIYGIFQELELLSKDQCFCGNQSADTQRSSAATSISDVRSVLYRFISHILNHPYVLMASCDDQFHLKSEFLSFLLSRVSQRANRHRSLSQTEIHGPFALSLSQSDGTKAATDQTSHSYTFAFLSCLVGNQSSNGGVGLRRDFLDSPELQYLASDLVRRLSIISFLSNNTLDKTAQCVEQAQSEGIKPRSSSFGSGHHSFNRSVSSASTASSCYSTESVSPTSPVSSVSSAPTCSPTSAIFFKASPSLFPEFPTHLPQQSQQPPIQLARLLNHEGKCLNLCLEGLAEAGIDRRTANIIKLFVDFTALSEQIYNDPNVGSCYQPIKSHKVIDHACILDPLPVPQKKNQGSVAAARAALSIPPLATKDNSRVQSFAEGDDRTLTPNQEEEVTIPMERDWSWNKKPRNPANPIKRASRTSEEVTRVEQIMSTIDGPRGPPKILPEAKSRTTSESEASWVPPKPKIDAQKRLTLQAGADAETIKLAKSRVQTQQRLNYNAQKKVAIDLQNRAMAEAQTHRRVGSEPKAKSVEDATKQEIKRRATCPDHWGWVKAMPSVEMLSVDVQKRKLQKASRFGGPRWKAPF